MTAGMIVRSYTGFEGRVEVPGLGAVVAIFSNWSIKRREENASSGAEWTLHAVLSYQNPSLLMNEAIGKKFICILNSTKKIELCGYESMKLIDENNLLVEGVIQCQ